MVTHPETVRNALANWITSQIDAGKIVFVTASDATVATLLFGSPAFGDAVDGVATANPIAPDAGAIGGTIAKAKFFDSDDNEIVRAR